MRVAVPCECPKNYISQTKTNRRTTPTMNNDQILAHLRNQIANAKNTELGRAIAERITPERIVEALDLLPPDRREKALLRLLKPHRSTRTPEGNNPS